VGEVVGFVLGAIEVGDEVGGVGELVVGVRELGAEVGDVGDSVGNLLGDFVTYPYPKFCVINAV
jgi:hypothetical protein